MDFLVHFLMMGLHTFLLYHINQFQYFIYISSGGHFFVEIYYNAYYCKVDKNNLHTKVTRWGAAKPFWPWGNFFKGLCDTWTNVVNGHAQQHYLHLTTYHISKAHLFSVKLKSKKGHHHAPYFFWNICNVAWPTF